MINKRGRAEKAVGRDTTSKGSRLVESDSTDGLRKKVHIQVEKTDDFNDWLIGLRDIKAKAIIISRIDRISLGHFGVCEPVRQGVSEIKINHGPGYRLYFVKKDSCVVILLCGGDKSTQKRDIKKAISMAEQL